MVAEAGRCACILSSSTRLNGPEARVLLIATAYVRIWLYFGHGVIGQLKTWSLLLFPPPVLCGSDKLQMWMTCFGFEDSITIHGQSY